MDKLCDKVFLILVVQAGALLLTAGVAIACWLRR